MKKENLLSLGIDIGSTTAKVVLAEGEKVIYGKYERHFSQVRQKTLEMLKVIEPMLRGRTFTVAVSGSAGMGLANAAEIPFVQEVYATAAVVREKEPDTSVVIELGGEDAKVIFFKNGVDERMNGTCAGGTGAFIDQMAVLLDMTPDEMDEISLQYKRLYPIASRCGVFAKTDIQPLLNQGANKADVAASIYQAVVNQTITGLAQGRKIDGKVLFLGGPLHYCLGLRDRFRKTLGLDDEHAIFPDYGLYSVALGAAYYGRGTGKEYDYETLIGALEKHADGVGNGRTALPPLFENEEEYAAFAERHKKASVPVCDISSYSGDAYLGIDCGSTTTKLVLIGADRQILYTFYSPNKGNPVEIVLGQLKEIRRLCGEKITIRGSAVTGYGEDLIKNAFNVDEGVVETVAHYTAAKYFRPNVDFILDIGGQDIKCFRIKNGAIDSIMLNEACSSGCGSFIETFARSMGYGVAEFAERGLHGRAPVNLGTRCTVFMNSSVKQSQKDGATVEDISAGLSISVVKNALYKVIRANSPSELGENIVVQGGTFCNDAVLRAFEKELGANVIRPSVAGLMGAYGAALRAMRFSESTLLDMRGLENFTHTSRSATCHGCTNNCRLTVNTFSDGKKFISGNRCERGLGIENAAEIPNLHAYKRKRLAELAGAKGKRGKIGMPMALGMYELAPLWYAMFSDLGYEVVFTEQSDRKTYEKGQFTIPSDTACYPAKIMHGHIEELISDGIDRIFYPCLTYNVDEKSGDNHYNCPVVAYYSELLQANIEDLHKVTFLYPYLNINDKKVLAKNLYDCLKTVDPDITLSEIKHAVREGFEAYEPYMRDIRAEGEKAVKFARENGKRIMILAGRPYHIDPEIGHGIDKLANSLGFVVVSEDSVSHLAETPSVRVLNQWTYHSRLYRAARYAAENDDVQLVQLVSFGCGIDAITTDEVRSVLEEKDKFYTQIKIDEITNLGAVRIRLRSLIGALEERGL